MATPSPGLPVQQQVVDLYTLRAEDFARNFESLRRLEWNTTFQVYAGYAGIALAYHSVLSPSFPYRRSAGFVASLLTLLLYGGYLYLLFHLQRRLHRTRAMQNVYLNKLHEMIASALPEPADPPEANW